MARDWPEDDSCGSRGASPGTGSLPPTVLPNHARHSLTFLHAAAPNQVARPGREVLSVAWLGLGLGLGVGHLRHAQYLLTHTV